ncbi:MAG TPA: hypothetical protein VI322_04825 [Candidatus Saccharimonadia bacterium]
MILALKTADRTTQAWLLDPAELQPAAAKIGQPQLDWESGRRLSDELLGRLTGLIESGGHQLTDLTGIVIFSGPGSFTSLRIGHATVNALADGLNIPVVGAAGDAWLTQGIKALASAKPGVPVLPEYGAEAHITKPKA